MSADVTSALKKESMIKIDGKDYTISPITLNIYSTVAARVRQLRREEAKELLNEFPDCKERHSMIRELFKSPTDADVQEYLGSVDGNLFVTWLCINKAHPDFTLEQFLSHGMDAIAELTEARAMLEEEDTPSKKPRKGRTANR